MNDLHSKFFPHYGGVPIKSNTLYLSLPYLQSLCKSPCVPLSTKQSVVERSPWAEGGLVFAKDNAPRPNDGDAEWTGMYNCKVTPQWVVCDLMKNSRTVYARI